MRVNSSPRSSSARAIRSARQREPEARVLGQRRLDLVDDRPEGAGEADAAQDLEALVGAVEVRLGVLDDAAEVGERRAARLQHRGHLGVDRQAAEVAAPGDPQRRRIAARGVGGEALLDRQRVARVGAGERLKQQRGVGRACARSGRGRRTGSTGRPGRSVGIRPGVGRRPTRLQNAAGLRTLAPRSEPSANGSIPAATAAAAPPLEPPGVFVRSYGLRVAPKTALNVCEPAPNSGVFVLPMIERAGGAQALDEQRVVLGHVLGEQRRAVRRAHPRGRPRGP